MTIVLKKLLATGFCEERRKSGWQRVGAHLSVWLRDVCSHCKSSRNREGGVHHPQDVPGIAQSDIPRRVCSENPWLREATPHIRCSVEYILGEDLRHLMKGDTGENTCSAHQGIIIDAAARLLHRFFSLGILPSDMMPRNVVLCTPDTASSEECCPSTSCPWQMTLHSDLTISRPMREHPYTPHMWMIDLENEVVDAGLWLTDEAWKMLALASEDPDFVRP
ncbi:hypothetical protein C8R44DRAFT_741303 [Mycena epipterygia]|nr:hypothetical protein C8R44DRAFT_741303 [Mycena epipterygia]